MVDMELSVSPILKNLLPPLTDEEKEQLEANILFDKLVQDPIRYWHDGKRNLIVDGHHRHEIAIKHGIPYRTEPLMLDNIHEVKIWMLNHALGRRSLTNPVAVREIRAALYEELKGERGGDRKSNGQNVRLIGNAAEIVAEKAGVDERTVRRDAKFVASLDKLTTPLKDAIESGKLKLADSVVHALAGQDSTTQQTIARDVRTQGISYKQALEKRGVKVRDKASSNGTKSVKPKQGKEKVSAAKLVDQLTRDHVGKLVRGIDAVAEANGGKGPAHELANDALDTLIKCLKKMRTGQK